MKIIIHLALFVCLCMGSRSARADYSFVWAGNSNLFHGTFEVTDAEMDSANRFYSLSLSNSIYFTDPDGNIFQWNSADGFGVGGSGLTNSFGLQLFENTPQGTLELEAFAYNDTVEELLWPPSGTSGSATTLYTETGTWSFTYIPEPSAVALSVLGAAAWHFMRIRRIFR